MGFVIGVVVGMAVLGIIWGAVTLFGERENSYEDLFPSNVWPH